MKFKALIVVLAFVGCATFEQVHLDVAVNGPTAIVSGPAHGHWSEEDNHEVLRYIIDGTDCKALVPEELYAREASGVVNVGRYQTFCVRPLRDRQRILFHGDKL